MFTKYMSIFSSIYLSVNSTIIMLQVRSFYTNIQNEYHLYV